MDLYPENKLTPRELDVVRMVAAGEINAQIAAALGVSEQVVKNYLRRIFYKVGCTNRVQCAVWWLRMNDNRDDVIAGLRSDLERATRHTSPSTYPRTRTAMNLTATCARVMTGATGHRSATK